MSEYPKSILKQIEKNKKDPKIKDGFAVPHAVMDYLKKQKKGGKK